MPRFVGQSPELPGPADGWDAEKSILLTNRYGLHMRPSKQVVELANTFPCDIILSAGGQEVDAKSILGLIGLGAECGVDIAVKARGERAAEAVKRIAELLSSLPELHGEPRDAAPSDQEPEGRRSGGSRPSVGRTSRRKISKRGRRSPGKDRS